MYHRRSAVTAVQQTSAVTSLGHAIILSLRSATALTASSFLQQSWPHEPHKGALLHLPNPNIHLLTLPTTPLRKYVEPPSIRRPCISSTRHSAWRRRPMELARNPGQLAATTAAAAERHHAHLSLCLLRRHRGCSCRHTRAAPPSAAAGGCHRRRTSVQPRQRPPNFQ